MSCGAYADKGLLPSGHRKAPAQAQVRHCGSAPVPATGALVKHGSSTQPLPGGSCYCWPVVLSALFSGQAPLHVCQPWPFLSRMAGAQPRCGWWRKPSLSPNPQCLLPPNTLINCFGVSTAPCTVLSARRSVRRWHSIRQQLDRLQAVCCSAADSNCSVPPDIFYKEV